MDKYQQSKLFFDEVIDDYADETQSIQPEFYRNAAAFIDVALSGCKDVLDIGNGGVINYDFAHLARLDCADLSLSQTAVKRYASYDHIAFFASDIFDLKEIDDNTYDAVIVQAVLHHLAGSTRKQTDQNVLRALSSCMRVLKPGGRLLIVESVVPRSFELIERLFYPLMQLFFKLCKFGAVYQYSAHSLGRLIQREGYAIMESAPIALDRYVWVMRRKIPTALTPCRAVWLFLKKEEGNI